MSSQSGQPPQQPADQDVLARTLKVSGLKYWMDTNFLFNCFSFTGELKSVKVIKNDENGPLDGGDGFIEFKTRAFAEGVYKMYNRAYMPDDVNQFMFEWPSFIPEENIGKYVISVANLSEDVDDSLLEKTFKLYYNSVKGAKVEIDESANKSKCCGSVKFADKIEYMRALVEMEGVLCSNLPMQIGQVTKENPIDMTIDNEESATSDPSNSQMNKKRKDREASTTHDVSNDEHNVGDPASS